VATSELPEELLQLPWFTYADAMSHGLSKYATYQLRDCGAIVQLARGIYQASEASWADPALIAAVARRPESILCLQSALARHDLTDAIPMMIDLALPRGTRRPRIDGPIEWHSFDGATFAIGRSALELAPGVNLGIYSPERCIIDAFRLRGREGHETANEALKRWLRRPGSQPATLLTMAQRFPRTEGPLRQALEILL